MWKIVKVGKSLKSWKVGIILKNIFYLRKKEKFKILEKYARICGKLKNLEKSGKKCEK